MLATTLPMPPSPPPADPEPRRRRPATPRPSPAVALAAEVLAALAALPATPTLAALAAATGRPPGDLAPALDAMERAGLVERWRDPDRPGAVRVMLSARALARIGLELDPDADRWRPAGADGRRAGAR